MKVREVLEIAREAAVKLRQLEELSEVRLQSIGVQGHNSFEVHAKSGILDPMRHVIELMDWQEELVNFEDLQAPIDDGFEIISGAAHISDSVMIEVATRYYLQGESWHEIIDGYERDGRKMPPLSERMEKLGEVSRSKQFDWCKKALDIAVEQWERIGIAHLKEMGRA